MALTTVFGEAAGAVPAERGLVATKETTIGVGVAPYNCQLVGLRGG